MIFFWVGMGFFILRPSVTTVPLILLGKFRLSGRYVAINVFTSFLNAVTAADAAGDDEDDDDDDAIINVTDMYRFV